MTRIFSGKRYEFDDEDVLGMVKIIRGLETNVAILFAFIFPKLIKMFPKYLRNKLFSDDVIDKLKEETCKLCKVGNIYLISLYYT